MKCDDEEIGGHFRSAFRLAGLDWFIPEVHKIEGSGDELRRARLTISIGLFAGLAVLGTLVAATDTLTPKLSVPPPSRLHSYWSRFRFG